MTLKRHAGMISPGSSLGLIEGIGAPCGPASAAALGLEPVRIPKLPKQCMQWLDASGRAMSELALGGASRAGPG